MVTQCKPQSRHPLHLRRGSSLPEVLVALVVLATTAGWSLMAVAAAQRAHGASELHRAAVHRAELALAGLDGVPCDSAVAPVSVREARWQVTAARTRAGDVVRDIAAVHPSVADTVQLVHLTWCR